MFPWLAPAQQHRTFFSKSVHDPEPHCSPKDFGHNTLRKCVFGERHGSSLCRIVRAVSVGSHCRL